MKIFTSQSHLHQSIRHRRLGIVVRLRSVVQWFHYKLNKLGLFNFNAKVSFRYKLKMEILVHNVKFKSF